MSEAVDKFYQQPTPQSPRDRFEIIFKGGELISHYTEAAPRLALGPPSTSTLELIENGTTGKPEHRPNPLTKILSIPPLQKVGPGARLVLARELKPEKGTLAKTKNQRNNTTREERLFDLKDLMRCDASSVNTREKVAGLTTTPHSIEFGDITLQTRRSIATPPAQKNQLELFDTRTVKAEGTSSQDTALFELGNREIFKIVKGKPKLAAKIATLAEKYPNQAELIFEHFTQMISTHEEAKERLAETTHNKPELRGIVDLAQMQRVIKRRALEFLEAYFGKIERLETNALGEIEERYQPDVVLAGGIFRAISRRPDGTFTPPEIVNEFFPNNIKAQTFTGDPNLIHFREKEEMEKTKNYSNLETFGPKNYRMIVRNLEEAHQKRNPGWLAKLVNQIPKDVSDPKTLFLEIKIKPFWARGENCELEGVYKVRQLPDGSYEAGTMYVNDAFQGFGMGSWLDKWLRYALGPDAKIKFKVSPNSKSMIRHIDLCGHVITGITYEEGSDEPLFAGENTPPYTLTCKTMSRKKIMEMGEGDYDWPAKMIIRKIRLYDQHYPINLLQPQFTKNPKLRLGRFFLDGRATAQINPEVWVVLEEQPEMT